MKILAISDNVLPQLESADNLRRRFGDVEVILSCGDLPAPYIEFISSTLNLPVLYVKGNHDISYEADRPGGDNLHRRVMKFHGLTFAGLEGSPKYNSEPLQYYEMTMLRWVLDLAPRLLMYRLRHGVGIDIMVTHAPPRGIHDKPDRAHLGFRSYNVLMNLYRPRYLLHGHVDTWDNRQTTETTYKDTQVININPMKVLTVEGRPTRSGLK
jgi:Icc-related predicted phosphoesterase